MKATPNRANDAGAASEQLSFLPPPPLSPLMPAAYSKAWLALRDLTDGPLTQIDWLKMGRGWRLAAAVKELDYLGWPLDAQWVDTEAWPRPIKWYALKAEGAGLAAERFKGAAA